MNKKTYFFQSEIKQLLNLMINSLYSNKEIFLRELISNSSDAINKLKFYYLSLKNKKDIILDTNYHIRIYTEKNSLIISDNGIGMTENEIIDNLGTIAKSGTKNFIKNLDSISNKNINSDIIGQFGVGFYSSFMVSDKVIVHSRSVKENNINNSVLWISDGHGKYTVYKKSKDSIGTDIILYIKESCKEFLNESKICDIIIKYSNHINIPIEYKLFNNKKKDFLWKKINVAEALWTKNKLEISKKEYKDFYYSLTNNLGNPIAWSHNKVEGKNEYISLLYIPDISPWNIWNRDEYKNGIKLYVCRVFVMEGIKKIIPFYLRFIQGIIDVNFLSLNISREILQDDIFINKLKISITNRILKILNNLSINKNKYNIFWKEFGNVLKEGLAEDELNRYKITLLLRFCSTYYDNEKKYVSLEEYINRMYHGQDKIYYIVSDNYISAINSPHLEIYKKKNIEVLLMFNRIDEWMMMYLLDFKGIKFFSINKNNEGINNIITLNNSKFLDINKNIFVNLVNSIKLTLGEFIKDVKLTDKLENFPVVLTTSSSEMSTQMSKLLSSVGKKVPNIKYIFEINIKHILIKYINNIKDKNLLKKWINYLYYQALLIETNSLDNPVEFINLSNKLISKLIIK